jgi:hypothetical protein
MTSDNVGWQITFYDDHRGNVQVLDFINRLSKKDQAKINKVLSLLKEFGPILGMPHARQITGDLWELRPGDNRLFTFCLPVISL